MFTKQYFDQELAKKTRYPEEVVSLVRGFFEHCCHDVSQMTPENYLAYIAMVKPLYRVATRAKAPLRAIIKTKDKMWIDNSFETKLIHSCNLTEEAKKFIRADEWYESEPLMYDVVERINSDQVTSFFIMQCLAWYGVPLEHGVLTKENFVENGIRVNDKFLPNDSVFLQKAIELFYSKNEETAPIKETDYLRDAFQDRYHFFVQHTYSSIRSSGLMHRINQNKDMEIEGESEVGSVYLRAISEVMYGV